MAGWKPERGNMSRVVESRTVLGLAAAFVLVLGIMPGCPQPRKTIAVPANAIALAVDATPMEGKLSSGQTAWYNFPAKGGRDYTVSIDSNPDAGPDAGLSALSQAYYEKVTDTRGNEVLQATAAEMKSDAELTPEADRQLYIQLTNDFPEDVPADVNYLIAVTVEPEVVGEATVELKVADRPSTVEYVQAVLQSGTPTWAKFAGVQGGNLHLAVQGDARITAAYASDRRTPVMVDASQLNVLNLPADGEYYLALSTNLASSTVQAGLILVSINPVSFADITAEWTPSAPVAEAEIALLKDANTWVKFTGIEDQNLFAGSTDGSVTATAYQSDLITPIDLNNIPANGSYAIALRAATDPYLVAQAGLEWVSSKPISAAEVNALPSLVVTTEGSNEYTPVVLTANGSTWMRFTLNGAQGASLEFTSIPGTAQLTAYAASDLDLANPVDFHSLTVGSYLAALRSTAPAARSGVQAKLYWRP